MTHPVATGAALGVAASFLAAACAGWAVAYHLFGPEYPRRVSRPVH